MFAVFVLACRACPQFYSLFTVSIRLRRLCSDDNDFFNKCIGMRSFFIGLQYSTVIVDRAITALAPRSRAASGSNPFVMNFYPVNNSIKPIVNRNFNLLGSDSGTSNVFGQRPLFSLKRDCNLSIFWLKEHRLPIKNLALFFVPASDV